MNWIKYNLWKLFLVGGIINFIYWAIQFGIVVYKINAQQELGDPSWDLISVMWERLAGVCASPLLLIVALCCPSKR